MVSNFKHHLLAWKSFEDNAHLLSRPWQSNPHSAKREQSWPCLTQRWERSLPFMDAIILSPCLHKIICPLGDPHPGYTQWGLVLPELAADEPPAEKYFWIRRCWAAKCNQSLLELWHQDIARMSRHPAARWWHARSCRWKLHELTSYSLLTNPGMGAFSPKNLVAASLRTEGPVWYNGWFFVASVALPACLSSNTSASLQQSKKWDSRIKRLQIHGMMWQWMPLQLGRQTQ